MVVFGNIDAGIWKKTQLMIAQFAEQMAVCVDPAFHCRTGAVPNLKVCKRDTWNSPLLVASVLWMLMTVCHLK